MEFEFLLHRAQWMVVCEHLHRPIGPKDQQSRRLAPPRDSRDKFQGREIAPLQILEQQHQRRFRRERLQGLRHLTQHPLLCHPLIQALQPRTFIGRKQRGHLRQPHRREPVEEFDHPLAAGFLAEAAQCLEHRHVRLARPVLLDALAAPEAQRILLCNRVQEHLNERGLADAGLAGDEDYPPLTFEDVRIPALQPYQFVLTADDYRLGTFRYSSRLGRCVNGRIASELPDEAVSPAMHGLDEARGLRYVAQRFTQLLYTNCWHRVADRHSRPNGIEQCRLRHQLPGMIDQVKQHVEGLAP
ncbi:MAG: hypothetical protein WAN81_24345 [Candidatus Binataceae bacterium]